MKPLQRCPDCESSPRTSPPKSSLILPADRRTFLGAAAATAAGLAVRGGLRAEDAATADPAQVPSENLVKKLYHSLSDTQKGKICFAWDHKDARGVLRTHVSNNWSITDTKMNVGGEFFTADQRNMIEAIFFGLYDREWHDRLRKQLQDDAGGYGKQQTIAIFGSPDQGPFEFVMTGRHLTIRCDGNSAAHMAFGGPIFYGHAARGFNEAPDHPDNVYWHQALKANSLYTMFDGRQRNLALIEKAPAEQSVGFKGQNGQFPGIPLTELSSDQKGQVKEVLKLLVAPYRESDRAAVTRCLDAQGGLDKCSLAFFKEDDIGNDGVWDLWRLEGPSFVWHFRGSPHVHVWVNVGDDPSIPLNADV